MKMASTTARPAERLSPSGTGMRSRGEAPRARRRRIEKTISPHAPEHLLALSLAGAIGFLGNEVAALVRLRAGRRLNSPALVADG
jgi:hypothetical protein